MWDVSDESSAARPDHAPWQTLLDTYLVSTDDGRTLFSYDAVTAADEARLNRYVAALAAIDPRTLTRAVQLPYWINLYNAVTVQVVLAHPRADSILGMGGGLFRRGPWNDELLTIAGEPVTLNDIEHRVLRPIWQDPRIHFAVNCASLGCPDLAAQAYGRDNAQELLEAGEHAYLHHPRGLHFDASGVLHLSSIFDWYVADFGGSRTALLGYLAKNRPDLRQQLLDYSGRIRYEYDWSLNDTSSWGGVAHRQEGGKSRGEK